MSGKQTTLSKVPAAMRWALYAICLIGPVGRGRDRLTEYRAAGLDLPILWPGLGVHTAREAIAAFRQ